MLKVGVTLVLMSVAGEVFAQANGAGVAVGAGQSKSARPTADAAASPSVSPAASPSAKTRPLQLQTLGSTALADPFPAVDARKFTADTPSVAMVESYLHAVLGFDVNRIWRVMSIERTKAAGVSKVVALVAERTPNAKVQTAVFFVLPDGKHLIADTTGVQPFAAQPYAEDRALLQAQASGPARGAAAKDLLLVEFTDLQCPRCKEAQPTMARLAQDFPKARIVSEDLPLTSVHPFAYQAAAYGVCVAQKSSDAYYAYAQNVYDSQAALTTEKGEQTLKDAATKAGLDPAAIANCASSEQVKNTINTSMKLASDLGINQTPTLAVNGRLLPLTMPYETLKAIIIFQAGLDGIPSAAMLPSASGAVLKPR